MKTALLTFSGHEFANRGLHKYVGTLETYTSILKALCGFNEPLNQAADITHVIWIISDTVHTNNKAESHSN